MSLKVFQGRFEQLQQEYDSNKVYSNDYTRKIYSKVEFLRMDVEDFNSKNESSVPDEAKTLIEQITALSKKFTLKPIQRTRYIMDDILRFTFINSGLYFLGVFASLPLIIIKTIEESLHVPSSRSLAVYIRKIFAWIMLTAGGVTSTVLGLDEQYMHQLEQSKTVSILTFAHTSNFDGFLVSLTCPYAHYALAKKELFIIPYFSWLSFAIGGVPVDRQNRQRAVNALKRSTAAAKNNQVCLVIAPEGTRSTTGLLLPFKKGTFHMWEELQSPILPFIVYGGYDLFPVGTWLNLTGHVIIRYLPMIQPHEANSRDEMLNLVRRRMLEALAETPVEVGGPISWIDYIKTYIVSICLLLFNIYATMYLNELAQKAFRITSLTATIYFLLICFFITVGMFVYNVYIVDKLSPTVTTTTSTHSKTK